MKKCNHSLQQFSRILLGGAVVLSMLFFATAINAQSVSQKQIKKDAKKECKRLSKEGWQVAPGSLPLERQLQNVFTKQYETDENGSKKFLIGSSQPIAQHMDAAKTQAGMLARQSIAEQVSAQLTALIEAGVANKQLTPDEAVSTTQVIAKSKELISAKLGRTIPLVQCYRKLENGNIEYLEQIGYPVDEALEQAKDVIREQLDSELKELSKKLDEIGVVKKK